MAGLHSQSIDAVASVALLLTSLLARAQSIKGVPSIEPPLEKSDFGDEIASTLRTIFSGDPVLDSLGSDGSDARRLKQYAVIETAVRDLFSNLIATIPIESPEFVQVWNLLDLLSIMSDTEQCDPALQFWLVEELLDSQTISGCQKIFDFLESRRERITAKHFKQKQLIILRSCNELLRRLSRAEDTAFCGRVFIFMFQSFPLGDKSSVNLRGEYHVENVTVFGQDDSQSKMETDNSESNKPSKDSASSKSKEEAVDPDTLYPIFWSLQESFSQPKKLFDPVQISQFKNGLESTMKSFKAIQMEQGSRQARPTEDSRRNLARKKDNEEESSVGTFNPKYLTSRDLFELEISDLSFRRHVLVQALIILDFLVSLSAKAKEKLSSIRTQNKSVAYLDQTLSEDDAKWAATMKRSIADYLRQGPEGPYFHRMVETILSRDKNWVRWKVENCPPIEKPSVPPEMFIEARKTVKIGTTNKRLRATPMSTLDLGFLDDIDESAALGRLKSKERFALPDLADFKDTIADDDYKLEGMENGQDRSATVEAKASKGWRALRIAGKTRLAAFDRIDDPDDIDAIFKESAAEPGHEDVQMAADSARPPEDTRPLLVSGPSGCGKTEVIRRLMARHPGVFGKVVRHTTREPKEGEVDGRDYHFVTSQNFNMMLDSDRFIDCQSIGGFDFGTTRYAVESVVEAGKIPIVESNSEAPKQAADSGFQTRLFLITPPSREELESRLKASDAPEADIEVAVKSYDSMDADLAHGLVIERTLVNQDVEACCAELEEAVYATRAEAGLPVEEKPDTEMVDTEKPDAEMTEAEPEG